MRLELLLRSVFFWLMTPDDLGEYLAREAGYHETLPRSTARSPKPRTEATTEPAADAIDPIAAEAGMRRRVP